MLIVLDSPNRKLVADQASMGMVNCNVTVTYADHDGSTFVEGTTPSTLDGMNKIVILDSPASGVRRVIKSITFYNSDDMVHEVGMYLRVIGGMDYPIVKIQLPPKGSWSSDDQSGVNVGALTNGDKGDIVVTDSGQQWTLKTVNANVGQFGSATNIPKITVNAKGLVTAISTEAISIPSGSLSFTGEVTGSGFTGQTTTLNLSSTGVTAATYGSASKIPIIAIDSKGRITSASEANVSIPSGSISVTGSDLTMSGSTGTAITNATLSTTGVAAGTYTKLTVDLKGRVTAGASLSSSDLPTYTGTLTSLQVTNALGFTPYNTPLTSTVVPSANSGTGSIGTSTEAARADHVHPLSGGSMTYPAAGVAISTGSAWATSKTAPTGDFVGTTDTQTLTNKTYMVDSLSNGSGIRANGSDLEIQAGGQTTAWCKATNGNIILNGSKLLAWGFSSTDTPNVGLKKHGAYRLQITNGSTLGGGLTLGDFPDGSAVTLSSISLANPAVFTTATNHGLVANSTIKFSTTGSLPSPLFSDVVYYVLSTGLTSTTFQVSLTPGGTAINTTNGGGSGTHQFRTASGLSSVLDVQGILNGAEIQPIGANRSTTLGASPTTVTCFSANLNVSPTAAVNQNSVYQAGAVFARTTGSQNIGWVYGLSNIAYHGSTGTAGNVIGLKCFAYGASGITSNGIGISAQVEATNTGNIQNAEGIRIDIYPTPSSNGTITNAKGININNISGFSGTAYGVFVAPSVDNYSTKSNSWTTGSDLRTKRNIRDYTEGLSVVKNLQPKRFEYNGLGETTEGFETVSFIAQEILEHVPEMIGTRIAKLHPTDEEHTELYTLNTDRIRYLLINAIKELDTKIETLEAEIANLKALYNQ